MTRTFAKLFSLLALLTATAAFAPTIRIASSSKLAMADTAAVEQDPLAAYQQTDEQRTVMYRDDLIGAGEIAQEGKLLKVAYKGRLLATGVQFDQSPGYAFKLGDGKVIPGWEQGIGVR